ncbi:methyltransferase domain-containing protein [Candidatus Poribacteria bacterium]|nr:methyltransferase domain-containing protein [Candidatus Poribacteria bacterium]
MTYVNLVLDIGAGEGSFLSFLSPHIRSGIGIDPLLTTSIKCETYTLIPGTFPHDFSTCDCFDVITLLAVVEHIPEAELSKVADACWDYLKTGGRVIITVPHPFADKILDVLKFFRIIKGLSLEEHHGFNPEVLPNIFNRWKLIRKERWELGCNYLFIFETDI